MVMARKDATKMKNDMTNTCSLNFFMLQIFKI